jgi:hypothetical protein
VASPSSVRISGLKFLSFGLSWADASKVKDSAHGRDVFKYTYLTGKSMVWERRAPEVLPVMAGSVPGIFGIGSSIGSGVGCLGRLGDRIPITLRLQHVSGIFAMQFWQGSKAVIWC